eukprot:283704_1
MTVADKYKCMGGGCFRPVASSTGSYADAWSEDPEEMCAMCDADDCVDTTPPIPVFVMHAPQGVTKDNVAEFKANIPERICPCLVDLGPQVSAEKNIRVLLSTGEGPLRHRARSMKKLSATRMLEGKIVGIRQGDMPRVMHALKALDNVHEWVPAAKSQSAFPVAMVASIAAVAVVATVAAALVVKKVRP